MRDEDHVPGRGDGVVERRRAAARPAAARSAPTAGSGPGRRSRACAGARRAAPPSVGVSRAVTGPSGVTAHAAAAPRTSRCSISSAPSGSASRTSSAPRGATGGATASSQRGFSAASFASSAASAASAAASSGAGSPVPAGGLPGEDLDAAGQLAPLAQRVRLAGAGGQRSAAGHAREQPARTAALGERERGGRRVGRRRRAGQRGPRGVPVQRRLRLDVAEAAAVVTGEPRAPGLERA